MAKTSRKYCDMSRELEDILMWFESDSVDLDEAIAKYEKATQLISEMEKYLETAENKIRKISSG